MNKATQTHSTARKETVLLMCQSMVSSWPQPHAAPTHACLSPQLCSPRQALDHANTVFPYLPYLLSPFAEHMLHLGRTVRVTHGRISSAKNNN